jgi:hypothetical protein
MRKSVATWTSNWLIVVSLWLTTVATVSAAPLASATLQPEQISVGESAQLTLTSAGNGLDALNLPKVPGLEFRVVGQSRRVEIINGATLSSTSIIVRVIPQTAGTFTIPGLTAQPLILRVTPDNGGATNPYGSSNLPRRPPVTASGPSAGGIRLTADGAAFVRMNLPKRDVYVGETIPVDIEVGMRAGMVSSLNGFPTLTGSDFTLNNLSHQPERVEKLIDGQPFTLLTWHSVLAPVKPGTFPLTVETPLTIRVKTRPQRDSMIDDLLGDPFLQNFFGATVPKEVTVSSPTADLKVLPLPTEGRPRDFSGAVGSFKIASELSAAHSAVGEPLTVRLKISGSGNFDRVDTPMLDKLEQWKTYPPKSNFKAGDTVGFKGEKTFEQPVIASQPGEHTLPPLTFSYFDPTTRRFESARANPLSVTIAPSAAEGAAAPLSANAGAGRPLDSFGATLRADHAADGDARDSLVPLLFQARFLAVPSTLALLFAGRWISLRRSRSTARRAAGARRRLSQEANRALAQMGQAAAAGRAAEFFALARSALQKDLAQHWQVPAQDITAGDVEQRLGEAGADIAQVFVLADEANYAGDGMNSADFARFTQIVRQRLTSQAPA